MHLVTRNFTINDFGKYGRHYDLVISSTSNFILPFGTLISATYPTDLPSNPFPMGEFTEILPEAKSASLSATKV